MRVTPLRRSAFVAVSLALGAGLLAPAAASGADLAPSQDSAETPAPPASSGAVEASAFEPAAISWGRCGQARLRRLELQCGSLKVPLDHADPSGRTIRLALTRLKHTSDEARYRGVMLTNPGGPGASGRTLPVAATYLPKISAGRWDWIGIDPRGVGGSRPRLTCGTGEESSGAGRPPRSYIAETRADRRFWLRSARAYAESCDDNASSVLLPHMRTEDLADDLDLVRRALGQERIGFYGFSYGSLLGQVYATRYPSRLSSLVLDSNLDPAQSSDQRNADALPDLGRAENAFYRWVAGNRRSYRLGARVATVRKRVNQLERQLDRRPIRGLGPTDLTGAMQQLHYDLYAWPTLAAGISQAHHRDRSGILKSLLRDGAGDADGNSSAAYYAVTCTDGPRPSTYQEMRDGYAISSSHRALGWSLMWGMSPCLYWPAPAAPANPTVDGSGLGIPVLLAANGREGVTPRRWSEAVRAEFPTSALEVGGGAWTHIASTMGEPCIDAAVSSYLLNGDLPVRSEEKSYDRLCKTPSPGQQLRRRSARPSPADQQAMPRPYTP